MADLNPQEILDLVTVQNDDRFQAFLQRDPSGILMVAEPYADIERPVIKEDAGDFAKWLRINHPEVHVEVQEGDRLVLRSANIWLPLVFLASDIALPIYLNLVSSYLYARMKGALRNDKPRVNLSAEYQDPSTGVIKRFNFEGDIDALRNAVQKLDLNRFFNE